MATGTNSRADATAKVNFKPASPGDCLTDKTAREIERRLTVTLSPASQTGDAIVSTTPPEDKTKIWYLADENGVPTGESFRYNPGTGAWESTSQSIPPIPCISTNTGNLITLDANGCWQVTQQAIEQIAQSASIGISADGGNALIIGSDGGIYLSSSSVCVSTGANFIDRDIEGCIRVIPSIDTGNAVVVGEDDKVMVHLPKLLTAPITIKTGAASAGSVNLASFTTVPTWATHAIVAQPNNQSFIIISSGFVSHPALLADETVVLLGFIKAQP